MILDKQYNVIYQRVDFCKLLLGLGLLGEIKQALNDFPAADCLLNDDLGVFPARIFGFKILEQEAAVRKNSRKGVVDLVSDPGGELSEGCQLLRTD